MTSTVTASRQNRHGTPDVTDPSTLNMVVIMGVTGSGKSYLINKLAGRDVVREGADLNSCTQSCQMVPVKIGNTKTLVIDTPGFDDTDRPDSEILAEIARILTLQIEYGMQLRGIIYVHRISDVRYGRSSVKTFDIFRRLCGEEALGNVLLVTNRWHEVEESLGAERERQLRDHFWAYMLRRGSLMSRFQGDQDSAIALVSQLIAKESCVLALQHEISHQGLCLDQTAAGLYVEDNLETLKAKVRQELQSLEDLRAQLREDDAEMRRQTHRDWERERARLRSVEEQQVSLHQDVAEDVRAAVREKRHPLKLFSSMLPLIPPVLSLIGMFVGIPPGVPEVIAFWFGLESFSFFRSDEEDPEL